MWRLAVLAVPLAEIATFILVGGWIGLGPTLLLVVLAALAGALLLRRQGVETAGALRGAMRRGGDPGAVLAPVLAPVLARGGFRLAAAALLILPGFLSDALALLLLLPPVQRRLVGAVARRGRAAGRTVVIRPGAHPAARPAPPSAPSAGPVVEAEWEEVSPPKRPTHPPSGWTRH